ncbi:uncharacterized protein SPSK_07748 [Sporothrix schenckii 1099-18]|uniref:Uncharacterized protein n=2 Tax=Sporothrix schenckii TaxID=29908 RepID=U7Q146_SPOS1|nr:uncharacterized protein SPSK_07748 [Sporothrix schenckii 1099-18]ERT00735.1 hypothetical protein HMPREF1624_01967 [Sporothrix schenckii ATCC 58251]KJR87811.1 hypothetical protein SPSK_07748 [Sporothrix schenckii 1099-18]
MDHFNSTKTSFPAVYATDGFSPAQPSKARRIGKLIAKAVLAIVFLAFALVLIYQVVHDKQDYDALLSKYNNLLAEQDTKPVAPVATLVHRAMESPSQSYVYTTTTVTEGTTVTIETTASSSSLPASSSVSSQQCSAGLPGTVTVTVTGGGSSSVLPSSSPAPITVLETHVTTATIYVTASGLVTPKAETLTVTATATEFATVHGGNNKTSSGTSTSTAEGVWGTSASTSSFHLTHFPNTTTILSPYNTASTASYTLTVPPGVSGGTGNTGKLTTPLGTTTSQVDPVSTVVTVSGAAKASGVWVGMAIAAIFVAAFHF